MFVTEIYTFLLKLSSFSASQPVALPPSPLQLELTDGWYWVMAQCDEPLTALVRAGKIRPGGHAPIALCLGLHQPKRETTVCVASPEIHFLS